MNIDTIRSNWIGRVIDGRFTLLQWLGGSESRGVFLTELEGDRPQKAAIKLIPADAADAEARIARWEAITPLSHPHLMRLLHTGRCEIDNTQLLYAVTEYAEENLAEILPHRPLTPTETREMLDPIIDALSYLYGKGFVHGRLKPSNIMVVNDQLKLSCDSLHLAGEAGKHLPSTGVYDSPEAATGTISPAADIWSLGVILVEALTQRPPVWDRSLENEPTVPESIPEPFAGIARESLRSAPERRCTLGDVKARLKTGRSPTDSASSLLPAKLSGMVLAAAVIVLLGIFAVLQLRSRQTQSSSQAEVEQSEPATAAPHRSTAPPKHTPKHAAANDEVVTQVMPDILPKASATIHGQISVKIRVTVDADGNVSDAAFDSPGPSKYFAKAALEAARRWKFKPAQASGSDVSRVWILRFQFRQTGTEVTPVEESH